MIFFGTRGKTVSGKVLEGIKCPSCENTQFATFGILRYFHLYWIPTFLTEKKAGIECTHCKKTLIDHEIQEDLLRDVKESLFSAKDIIPLFSGLIIIACVIMLGAYAIQQDNKKETAYIEQPAIDDLYIVDFTKIYSDMDPEYKYGLMRISDLTPVQAGFQVSQTVYNKASGVRKDISDGKTSADSYYESELLEMEISELKGLKDSGAIYSIDRN